MLAKCSGAARQKRYRSRVKHHQRVAPVVYDGEILDLLVTLGWLQERETGDPVQIGKAIAALLSDTARRR
jgi:hypothetical protein